MISFLWFLFVKVELTPLLLQENKLDWGEETHNDVVYKVVLERIVRSSDSTAENNEVRVL